MVAKKNIRRTSQEPKTATKRIIYANDTSGTITFNRPRRAESTTISLEDFQDPETYDIAENLPARHASGFAAWKWVIDHWEVPAGVLAILATILIFATRLDAKVEVLGGDVKDVKSNVEKLMTENTKTGAEIGHLQRAVIRFEDQRSRERK